MAFPKITYGAGPTTLTFSLGPQNFNPRWVARGTSNLATSGAVRERVIAGMDILLPFSMQHLLVGTTADAWATFLAHGLAGGEFRLYPDSAQSTYYNCVLEDEEIQFSRNAPKKYGVAVTIRVLLDGQAPTTVVSVLGKLYGL